MTEFVSIEHPDDEIIEVYVGDELVASANHDEHGWSGMDAVERTALAVGRAASAEIERLRAAAERPRVRRDHNEIRRDRSAEAYWRSRISAEVYAKADEVSRLKLGAIRVGEAGAQMVRAVGDLIGTMPDPGEHRCPSCAPGYDCETGIYTPDGGEPR